jgi:uncharacterized protein YqgV (UPF0045/DUF77 family)
MLHAGARVQPTFAAQHCLILGVVTACFKALQTDCSRIGINLKVDYRAGTESRMRSKIDKVEAHLGRKLAT